MTQRLANIADYLSAVVRAHRGDPADQLAACACWELLTDEERAVIPECAPLPEWGS